MMRRQKKKSSKKSKVVTVQDRAVAILKQPCNFCPEFATTLRFTCYSTSSLGVTFQMLLNTIVRATSTTALVQEFHYVKLRRVRILVQPVIGSSGAAAPFAQLLWNAAGQASGLQRTCTAVGVEPGVLDIVPPQHIPNLSQWNNNTAGQAFVFSSAGYAVIEVDLSFRCNMAVNAAAMNTGTALAVGAVYGRGLDGLAIASTQYVPQTLDGTSC